MSFGDYERNYGSTAPSMAPAFQPSGRGGDQEYIQLNESVKRNIERISEIVGQYKRLAEIMGTPKDTAEVRQKAHDLAEDAKELIQSTTRDLKTLGRIDGGTPSENQQRRIQRNKLSSDFKTVFDRFQDTQKLAAERERAFVAKAKRDHVQKQEQLSELEGGDSGTDETRNLVQDEERRQQQQKLESDIEYDDALISEREEGIIAIQRDMAELNHMMKEVNMLVVEQGGQVDTITDNIMQTAVRTTEGTEELMGASKYQRSARNKMCWILLICTVIFAIVLVITLTKVL
jgi:t-SNARE complex subunit (syntaxin)